MLKQVASQLDVFRLDHDRYPDSLDDLITAPKYVDAKKYPPEGYISEYPTDGWGNRFVYRLTGAGTMPYELSSHGADGSAGGVGPAADIRYQP